MKRPFDIASYNRELNDSLTIDGACLIAHIFSGMILNY